MPTSHRFAKPFTAPRINARYWAAILLASVFGTNLGDLYAHSLRLGLLDGLAVLASLVAVVFVIERFDSKPKERYYWTIIILIRTGATNLADYLAYRAKIPDIPLTVGLLALIALFGWMSRSTATPAQAVPRTNLWFWLAMLSAGVFGTVAGDLCEHGVGEGVAALALSGVLSAVLLGGSKIMGPGLVTYWLTVTLARTTGTALGDWLAENHLAPVGLPLATLLSGVVFVSILIFWRPRAQATTGTGGLSMSRGAA